jgi:pyrroline-5-carboxylate reductase
MPNTPCLVGYGAAGYAQGPATTDDDAQMVNRMLEAVGLAFALPESQLDAVTGLSGSGPAFVALFIEALTDGGVRMGLPRAIALKLAAQTVRGTAELVLASDQPPAAIKDQVASPGGTTIAGIQALEERAFRGAVMAAVAAATERARQLGELK